MTCFRALPNPKSRPSFLDRSISYCTYRLQSQVHTFDSRVGNLGKATGQKLNKKRFAFCCKKRIWCWRKRKLLGMQLLRDLQGSAYNNNSVVSVIPAANLEELDWLLWATHFMVIVKMFSFVQFPWRMASRTMRLRHSTFLFFHIRHPTPDCSIGFSKAHPLPPFSTHILDQNRSIPCFHWAHAAGHTFVPIKNEYSISMQARPAT